MDSIEAIARRQEEGRERDRMTKRQGKAYFWCGIAALTALLFSVVFAAPMEYGNVFVDEIVRVYDGDTFYCNIYQWPKILGENIGIRINGVDTPEMRGSSPEIKILAKQAKAVVQGELTTAEVVVLKNIKRGKYFRVVADVECDGRDLARILIDAGLAKRYDGGAKSKW